MSNALMLIVFCHILSHSLMETLKDLVALVAGGAGIIGSRPCVLSSRLGRPSSCLRVRNHD